MRAPPRLDTAQYRLAQHYLNKLRTAAEAVRRGRANLSYGLSLFDQEWEQIKHWQSWSAAHSPYDEACARLCRDFSLVGLPVLAMRSNHADHAAWLETALHAAQQLNDSGAERALCAELMMTYYRLGALDKIKQYANRLLTLGEAADDALSIERGYLGLGLYAEESGLYSEAERHYQRVLAMAIELEVPAEIGRALNGLGSTAFCVGDYENAYRYHTRHLELTERSGTKSEFCTALLSAGEALTKLKAFDEAERYIRRSIAMCRALGFQRLTGVGLLNLGTWAVEQDQLDLARSLIEEGMHAVRASSTQRQVVNGLSMLGDVWLRLGNLPAALGHLQEGLQQASAPHHLCDLNRTLALTYLAQGDGDAAHPALRESLIVAQGLESPPQKVATLAVAVAYWRYRGWHEPAAEWTGLLTTYARFADPFVFNETVSEALELALGTEGYRRALERGRSLALDAALENAAARLV